MGSIYRGFIAMCRRDFSHGALVFAVNVGFHKNRSMVGPWEVFTAVIAMCRRYFLHGALVFAVNVGFHENCSMILGLIHFFLSSSVPL